MVSVVIGKSYQVKHKKGIEKFFKSGNKTRFVLLRRYKEEITPTKVEQYFQDVDIEKLSHGVYNMVQAYRRKNLFIAF